MGYLFLVVVFLGLVFFTGRKMHQSRFRGGQVHELFAELVAVDLPKKQLIAKTQKGELVLSITAPQLEKLTVGQRGMLVFQANRFLEFHEYAKKNVN